MSAEDENDEDVLYPPIQSVRPEGFRYTWAIDSVHTEADGSVADDFTVSLLIERAAGGEKRIVALKYYDRMRTTPEPVQLYTLTKGWQCRCGIHNGEEKEVKIVCRTCGGPRPS